MSQRTLDVDCPRCGHPVPCKVYRSDVRVAVIDMSSYGRPLADEMQGISADVELRGEHTCR